ncbi:hypothetical protein C4585_01575 [Candidatus Parcubacteria bacterium]|nr:MAG: hypothetical protein C4585_01575 [Candidatus Parcubacteria bacterium]
MTVATLNRLVRKLNDPATFIETMIRFQGKPVRLYDFQKEIARSINILTDRVCIQKARQIGGSLLVAWLIVDSAYKTNNATIIIVSKTREQATFIAQYVRESFESTPMLAKFIDRKKTTKHDLRLKNETLILDRTAGDDASNLRGISCRGRGCLVLDESAYVKSEATETLLHVCHGAGLLHCSTPRRPYGSFYDACRNPDYSVFKIPASGSPRITAEAIAALQRELRASQYRTDVLAEFAAGENSVFDAESVDKAIDHSLPTFDAERFTFQASGFPFSSAEKETGYYYALDVARSSALDPWVLYIGEYNQKENHVTVRAYAAWAGSKSKHKNVITTDDPNEIIRDINRFRESFPCRRFYIDATANEFFADHLANQFLYPVEKVIWSTGRKQLLIEHLSTCLDAGKVSIPNDSTLIQQLIDIAYDLKRQPDESEKKIYLAGMDDHVDAMSMLCSCVTTTPKYAFIDSIEAW